MVDKDLQNAGQEAKDSVALTENEKLESLNGINSISEPDQKPVEKDAEPEDVSSGSVEEVKQEIPESSAKEDKDTNQTEDQIQEESAVAEVSSGEQAVPPTEDSSQPETIATKTETEVKGEEASPEAKVEKQQAISQDEKDAKAEVSTNSATVPTSSEESEAGTKAPEGAVLSEESADHAGKATPSDNKDSQSADTDESEDEQEEEIDFSDYTKQQLADSLQELIDEDKIQKARKYVDEIFSSFEAILGKERQEAQEKFIADGGEEGAFQYSLTELDNRIEARYRLLKDKISAHYRDVNRQREVNYHKKQDLLDQMREIVDGEESDAGFKAFKDLQEEWKNTGPVPGQHNKTLWANYHALLDRFYDQRSIYFELKELDRKKNLEAKKLIVEKAEKLNSKDNLKDAIQELNDLHQEYKHLGPVPREEQEALWLKFKAASDVIYQKRKEYYAEQKSKLGENLEKKEALIEQIKELVTFNSKEPKEWNAKTKQVNALQKKWEEIGGLPRAKAKEVNKQFWGNFKQYFSNKNKFFKTLESEREVNLELKQKLITKAEELKDSTDWNRTTQDMKRLQQEWKKIGPVPARNRSEAYAKFKAACDHFFNARRESSGDIDKEYQENLKKKEEIIEKIKALKPEESDNLQDLQSEFNEIGFVPRSAIKSIRHNFTEAINGFIKRSGIAGEEKARIKMESEVQEMLSGPNADRRIRQKEQSLRKQIGKVEEEIALYKNNMEFFTGSSKAQTFKNQFTEKITNSEKQLKELKGELRVLRQMS